MTFSLDLSTIMDFSAWKSHWKTRIHPEQRAVEDSVPGSAGKKYLLVSSTTPTSSIVSEEEFVLQKDGAESPIRELEYTDMPFDLANTLFKLRQQADWDWDDDGIRQGWMAVYMDDIKL
ncbi:hypothetical protein cyc_05656 [Cyclospora cayetanensis]|uniref:Uncharacterized protein n=1 Tax=Cyclospora cayetanensis TaxID=88456 RepID=A0A1D3D4Y4_9EIME|nr:hypothetical protein cyc_05656 [Cyclospora cayetanensis]